MKREQKFPATDVFEFENVNPSNRITNDCVVRAIANAEDKAWDIVFIDLCLLGVQHHEMPNDKKVYGRYLEAHGWVKCNQPRKADKTKYTGAEFCREIGNMGVTGNVIAHIGGHHMVCLKPDEKGNYKVRDIWDSTGGCIGNYWIRGGKEQ